MTIDIHDIRSVIASGSLDDHLQDIIDAAEARQRAARISRDSSEYMIGDRVKFNSLCGTKYLHGQYATVVGRRRTKITVKLERPMGRFAHVVNGQVVSSDIIVPVSIVDKVPS